MPSAADEHTAVHFAQDGAVAHSDSEAATNQRAYEKAYKDSIDQKRRDRQRAAEEAATDILELQNQSTSDDDDELLQRNQFNYSERAAQTFNPVMKDRSVATVPVETHDACGDMSQWKLYDAYMAELQRATAQASSDKSAISAPGSGAGSPVKTTSGPATNNTASARRRAAEENPMHSNELAAALKTIERMVVQNAEDEVYNDYAYWEDASDGFKPGQGTLLPLWKFDDSRGNPKKKAVTAVAWNRLYSDMFAVGYGRYDFMKQGSGGVAIYTLKNVATPEFVYPMDCSAMCLAFHPQQPSVLAVGCYDGSVRVFDARHRDPKPIFTADVKSGRHSDPVWDVQWVPQTSQGDPLCFLSVSSDGKVARWTVTKAELRMEEVMALKLGSAAAVGAEPFTSSGSDSDSSSSLAHSRNTTSSLSASGGLARGSSEENSGLAATNSSISSASSAAAAAGLASGICFDFNPFDRTM